MVNTKKFSEFAAANLTTTTKKMAGISNTSGGENIIVDFTVEWTTVTRPAPPYDGLLGYNTNLKEYEYYNSSTLAWIQLADNAVFVDAKFIVQQPSASLPAAQALSALTTGILKSTTTTGVLSISAPLTSIDGLTTSSDKMIYTTASNVYAVTDLTAFARTLLDDSTAAAMRTTLGLGQAAVKNVTDNTKANVASVTGAFTVNHVLLAADVNGTVKDGGSPAGMGTVLEVDTGTGLTGGSITTTGTISLDVPVVVANGGTGNTTFTAYSVVCAGTTATGAFQNVSGVGTANQVLVSQGAGALPQWGSVPGLTPAALTKVDDTNVTLTLGGTPATALLQATSITVGWTGTLSPTRGGTGVADPTAHGIMVAEGSSAVTPIVLSSGQILIGSTGVDPVAAAINSGTGILVGNGAGSITVSLAAIASHDLLSNITGGSAAPIANTLTATIDAAIGSTQGNLLYRNSTVWTVLAPGTAGQLLATGGAAANPAWTTSTFPATGGTAGNILISNGTNYIASTSLWPNTVGTAGKILRSDGTTNAYSTSTFTDTYAASALLYSNGANTVTGLATANSSVLVTTSAGVPVQSGTMTNGQLIIGSAGATPTVASLTAGTGISVTPGAGSISIATTGAVVTPAALTKTDDTNVTLTLGGSPSTALVNAASLTLGWTGQLAVSRGGTGNSTFTAYSVICAGTTATGAFQNVSGVGTSGQVLQSNGAAALPTWATIPGATSAALTKVDDTNVTLTLGGAPTTALLTATSITAGWTGQLGLTRGGTAASLTASNGGIVYSTASALAILSGTATAGQILQSGASTTPAWSTTTYPATNAINTIMYASSANVLGVITPVNSAGLLSNGSGVPAWVTATGTGAPVLATSPTITTPKIAQINDSAGLANLTLSSVASAVNNFNLSNSATGIPVILSAVGTDSNIGIQFRSKVTGSVSFYTEALTNQYVFFSGTSAQHTSSFLFPTTAASQTYTFPDSTGTIALTSGIPSLPLSLANGGTAAALTASNGGIVYSNASTLAILSGTATAGLALLSGASTTPSWSTSPPITQLVKQSFTTNGTYTPTTGMKYCIIEIIGAGGGGGGAASTPATTSSAGGGGGGGAYAKRLFTAAQVGATATVTVSSSGGAGGTTGNNNGTTGGTTTVALTGSGTISMTASGGVGGNGSAVSSATVSSHAAGGGGGTAGNADITTYGGQGGDGISLGVTLGGLSGKGADSIWGQGGGQTYSQNGSAGGMGANGFGSGGSGGSSAQAAVGTAGGNGAPGFVYITEYISV